jgi:hypothetical protein
MPSLQDFAFPKQGKDCLLLGTNLLSYRKRACASFKESYPIFASSVVILGAVIS